MNELIVPGEVLTHDEVELVLRATLEYFGPAHCSEEMAYALGFEDKDDLLTRCREYRQALRDNTGLGAADWARVLMTAELAFISDLQGSGVEWATTVGIDDCVTVRTFRSIHRKMAPYLRGCFYRRPD